MESSGITLRKMKIGDLDQIMEIEKVSFPTPWSRQAFLYEILDNDLAFYIVAERDEQLLGYAGLWVILDEGHVTTIAVNPQIRRSRVGESLLRELEALAAQTGVRKMTLEVRPSNYAAQALYYKLGYVMRGVRKGYYSDTKEDAIIMWKDQLGCP